MTITQCLLYGVSFLFYGVCWGAASALKAFVNGGTFEALGEHYWVSATINTLLPLQGLFFLLIYLRPRYLSIRSNNSETTTRWRALILAITQPVAMSRASRRRSSLRASRSQSLQLQGQSLRRSASIRTSQRISNPSFGIDAKHLKQLMELDQEMEDQENQESRQEGEGSGSVTAASTSPSG